MNVHVQQLRFPLTMDVYTCYKEIENYVKYAIDEVVGMQFKVMNESFQSEYLFLDKNNRHIGQVTISKLKRKEYDEYHHYYVIIETNATIKP